MSIALRITGLNTTVLLLLAVAARLNVPNGRDGIAYVVEILAITGIQLFINIVLAIVTKQKKRERAYGLSIVLVFLLGCGACVGGLLTY